MGDNQVKDFAGYRVFSMSGCCSDINGKTVERTIKKAFPDDDTSTLYIIKLKGVSGHVQLYEDDMYN